MNPAILIVTLVFLLASSLSWLALRAMARTAGRAAAIPTDGARRSLWLASAPALRSILIRPAQVAALPGYLRFGRWALPVLGWVLTQSVVIVALGLAVALILPGKLAARRQQRRLRAIEAQLPDTLQMLSGALRAGASLPIALESGATYGSAPISEELGFVLREMRLGVDLADALNHLEQRVPVPDLLIATAAMNLAREIGANLAETLDALARTLRSKQQMEGKIRSLTAQGKLQGVVMAGMPVLLLVVLNFIQPEAMWPLLHRPIGWALLAVMALFDVAGYHFIRRITEIDV
jgi:tight adherence protein B